jgi:2-dehydro-3-deoxyphosphogluconate aldolase/(4S)-4-hydroxy-2-oxoglutarate aldolase
MIALGPLATQRIVPVIVIDDAGAAVDLAHALAAGGIPCAEVTLRTPAALAALAAMAGVDGFTAGAGTVRSLAELEAATAAGATFAVSPGLDPQLVAAAADRGLGVLPGVATATELQHALRLGVRTVKFFPADRLGGLAGIAALAAPFPEIGFIPSGGVTAATAPEYLAHPAVPAVSGSWMAPRQLLADRDFRAIERLAAATTAAIGTR